MCCAVAGPAVATSIAPGRARAASARSPTVRAGKEGWQITISGPTVRLVIAAKSRSGS